MLGTIVKVVKTAAVLVPVVYGLCALARLGEEIGYEIVEHVDEKEKSGDSPNAFERSAQFVLNHPVLVSNAMLITFFMWRSSAVHNQHMEFLDDKGIVDEWWGWYHRED